MTELSDRIAQFRKMTTDDPDNELGHFKLGQLLAESGKDEEAVASFQRTLELSPQFSKVYQLLGGAFLRLGRREDALRVLKEGFGVADERGDRIPRDEMAKMLHELGEAPPQAKATDRGAGESSGFRCQRPGCVSGARARRLAAPPMGDEIGRRIQEEVCADCWQDWLRNYSIKVINELRLDLSTERDQATYDRYMLEFLGLQ